MSLCVPISDPITFVLSIVGIAISLLFIAHVWLSHVEQGYDKELEDALYEWIKSEKKHDDPDNERLKILLRDYEITHEELGRRDNITLLIGTILITSSLLILGNVASKSLTHPISIYALASIGLFTVWLLVLHNTTKNLNRLSYDRIKAIERALSRHLGYDFGIITYINKKTQACCKKDESVWWLRLRRIFWGVILLLLSSAWMLLSLT
jgi:hypothetical protein